MWKITQFKWQGLLSGCLFGVTEQQSDTTACQVTKSAGNQVINTCQYFSVVHGKNIHLSTALISVMGVHMGVGGEFGSVRPACCSTAACHSGKALATTKNAP